MNNKQKIAIICGARPNFMKVSPLCKELDKNNVEQDYKNLINFLVKLN